MAFIFRTPKRMQKAKSKSSQEVLDKLEQFLNSNTEGVQQILCGFWKDQQNAITYQELRQLILDEAFTEEMYHIWQQDYSNLVSSKLSGVWERAMQAGSGSPKILEGLPFSFNLQTPGAMNWLNQRGATFVTSCMDEQRKAMQALLSEKMMERHTVDELSRMIRPCIGLTKTQTKANTRYYDSVVAQLKRDHPKMSTSRIKRKALDAATKHAERKHRERAMTIAQTESAFAYNRGADEGIRQAQEENLLGRVKKVWSTSGDANVCDTCRELEGTEIEMDEEFHFKGKILFAGQGLTPPAHPRCACAIEYIEVSPPACDNVPQMNVSITESNSFKEYNDEEIKSIAKQTEAAASKHISTPSKWSGKMVINDDGIIDGSGNFVEYGKMWSCDILTKHETAPSIILHEQVHARSVSYYNSSTYIQFAKIEEASVQLMTEEICLKEGIEIIASQYDDLLFSLKTIGTRLGYNSLYDFAKALIEIPLTERLNWLSNGLYDILRNDPVATLEEYQKLSELLNILY